MTETRRLQPKVLDLPGDAWTGDQLIRYGVRAPYPWARATSVVRATEAEAFADAEAWARDYEQKDPMGNMAMALGVLARDGGWVGVINYFHSNT